MKSVQIEKNEWESAYTHSFLESTTVGSQMRCMNHLRQCGYANVMLRGNMTVEQGNWLISRMSLRDYVLMSGYLFFTHPEDAIQFKLTFL